ncbi:TetR family transcriptional regulator [Streptoalloteichus hindustanus]|uniref:Transcriptional regulator, TetR family n=1 Tax=Streptoalloteichus hindustanus TaxID=2017 RepID=A0A1M5BLM8_STRHI|nr:TetR family transcriptional regulator [Streptoalloteichus hindustanus]SHF43280.1 transcriptional regulator, TetR family [Streptoalloteichus hindustanus]
MPRDAEATKARIFAAASAEFAAHGVAGARVERIARAANANKQLIYAYFGDKEGLFNAVLQHALRELADAVPASGGDVEDYVDRLFDYHAEHPEVCRLLLWEALEYGDRPVPSEPERTAHYQDKVDAMATADRTGDALAPDVLTLLLLGLVGWPNAVPQVRRMLLGPDGPDQRDRLRAAVRVAARRLTTRP